MSFEIGRSVGMGVFSQIRGLSSLYIHYWFFLGPWSILYTLQTYYGGRDKTKYQREGEVDQTEIVSSSSLYIHYWFFGTMVHLCMYTLSMVEDI